MLLNYEERWNHRIRQDIDEAKRPSCWVRPIRKTDIQWDLLYVEYKEKYQRNKWPKATKPKNCSTEPRLTKEQMRNGWIRTLGVE